MECIISYFNCVSLIKIVKKGRPIVTLSSYDNKKHIFMHEGII